MACPYRKNPVLSPARLVSKPVMQMLQTWPKVFRLSGKEPIHDCTPSYHSMPLYNNHDVTRDRKGNPMHASGTEL